MIRVGRLTDYAVMILCTIAQEKSLMISAQQLSRKTGLAETTVSKILKTLNKAGMLVSTRGVKGGYMLDQAPEDIALYSIIEAMEGGVAMTDCVQEQHTMACIHESCCSAKFGWQKVNIAVRNALQDVYLSDFLADAKRHAETSFYVQHQ